MSALTCWKNSLQGVYQSEALCAVNLKQTKFPNYGSKLKFGAVPDIATPGAFDEVVKSTPPFDIVIHIASPFLYKVISSNREFLDSAIKGMLESSNRSKHIHRQPSVSRSLVAARLL